MAKKKRVRSRLIQVDPTIPVEPSQHMPGSQEKIEELRERFLSGRSLHVEGDLLDGPGLSRTKAGNGRLVERHHDKTAKEDEPRHLDAPKPSTSACIPLGVLAYGDGLGVRIKAERLKHGWTLGQLSLSSGVDRSHIFNIENGIIVHPGIFTVAALAHALKVSLDILVPSKT